MKIKFILSLLMVSSAWGAAITPNVVTTNTTPGVSNYVKAIATAAVADRPTFVLSTNIAAGEAKNATNGIVYGAGWAVTATYANIANSATGNIHGIQIVDGVLTNSITGYARIDPTGATPSDIQSVINAHAGGGKIQIPPGRYWITNTLTFNGVHNLRLVGAGSAQNYGAVLMWPSVIFAWSNNPAGGVGVIMTNDIAYNSLENICIDGGGVVQNGIKLSAQNTLDHVLVRYCTERGTWVWDLVNSSFLDHISIVNCGNGLWCDGVDGTTFTLNCPTIRANTNHGIFLANGQPRIRDGVIEANGGCGLFLVSTNPANTYGGPAYFDGTWFEANGGNAITICSGSRSDYPAMVVLNNSMVSSFGHTNAIFVGDGGVLVSRNTLLGYDWTDQVVTSGTGMVIQEGDVKDLLSNYIDGLTNVFLYGPTRDGYWRAGTNNWIHQHLGARFTSANIDSLSVGRILPTNVLSMPFVATNDSRPLALTGEVAINSPSSMPLKLALWELGNYSGWYAPDFIFYNSILGTIPFYLSYGTGFIGIGTGAPATEQLEVKGNVLIQSNLTVNGSIVSSVLSSNISRLVTTNDSRPLAFNSVTLTPAGSMPFKVGAWELGSFTGFHAPDFIFYNTISGLIPLYLDYNNNFVGIGTNDPQAQLHVNGNALMEGTNAAAYYLGLDTGLTNAAGQTIAQEIAAAVSGGGGDTNGMTLPQVLAHEYAYSIPTNATTPLQISGQTLLIDLSSYATTAALAAKANTNAPTLFSPVTKGPASMDLIDGGDFQITPTNGQIAGLWMDADFNRGSISGVKQITMQDSADPAHDTGSWNGTNGIVLLSGQFTGRQDGLTNSDGKTIADQIADATNGIAGGGISLGDATNAAKGVVSVATNAAWILGKAETNAPTLFGPKIVGPTFTLDYDGSGSGVTTITLDDSKVQFTGEVDADSFVGPLTGNANTATAAVHSTNFWGQLSPTNFNAGTDASASTFLRGDGTWVTPAGSGQTNDAYSIAGDAFILLSTNGPSGGKTTYTFTLNVSGVTNGFATVTDVGSRDTAVSNGVLAASSNLVLVTSNALQSSINELTGGGATKADATNAALQVVEWGTNASWITGKAENSITNDFATKAYADAKTNLANLAAMGVTTNAWVEAATNITALRGMSIAENSITNNFATQDYANAKTNLANLAAMGIATNDWVQSATNGVASWSTMTATVNSTNITALRGMSVAENSITNNLATQSYADSKTNSLEGGAVRAGTLPTNSIDATFYAKLISGGAPTVAQITNALGDAAVITNSISGQWQEHDWEDVAAFSAGTNGLTFTNDLAWALNFPVSGGNTHHIGIDGGVLTFQTATATWMMVDNTGSITLPGAVSATDLTLTSSSTVDPACVTNAPWVTPAAAATTATNAVNTAVSWPFTAMGTNFVVSWTNGNDQLFVPTNTSWFTYAYDPACSNAFVRISLSIYGSNQFYWSGWTNATIGYGTNYMTQLLSIKPAYSNAPTLLRLQ